MSTDDLSDLAPLGKNPLDGDLLDDLAQPAPGSALTAGGPLVIDEGAAISPATAVGGDEGTQPVADEAREPSPGLLAKLAESNPYTVMLFVSLAALVIGIVCLLMQWSAYNFDTKAQEAGQSAQASAAYHPVS